MIRCWFGHTTRIQDGPEQAQIVCTRCGQVLDEWKLLRPEHLASTRQFRAEQQHAAFWQRVDQRKLRIVRDRQRA